MSYSDIVKNISKNVYSALNISKDIYRNFDVDSAKEFKHQFIEDTSYLRSMIADELYDAGIDIDPKEYEDLIEDIEYEVISMLEDVLKDYFEFQRADTLFTFHEMIQVLNNDLLASPVCSVIDIDVDDYGSTRFPEYEINLKLENGATIHMRVDFEEEYDNI